MKINVRMLHPIEEYELIMRVYTTLSKDKAAREKLFTHYLPLVKSEAARFNNMVSKRHISFNDLFSEACIGLLMAIDKFDPTRCQRLSPVAKIYIRDVLRVFTMNNTGVGIKLSQSSNARRIYFGVASFCRENNVMPPFTQEQRTALATKLKTTEEQIIIFEDLRSSSCALENVLEAPCMARSPEDQANFNLLRESMLKTVSPFLSELEQKLFKTRYLDADEVTLEEFAAANSLTYSKARIISTNVLRVIKTLMNRDHLVGLMGDRSLSSTRPLVHQV